MWISKLKLRHEDCPIVNRCQKFKIAVYSYPSTWYEEKGKKFATTTCFFQSDDELQKKKFLNDLKSDRRITNIEISGDMFTYEIKLGNHGEHVMLYHTKQIFFVKPVVNHPDGYEYWEVASWKKYVLSKFIKDLDKHMDVCNIMKLEQSPINDIHFPTVMPKLSKQQKNALKIAYDNDYYSYPRKKSLETLSKIAGVSVSTFQEHLRKAELKLLPVIIEQQLRQETE
jgi:predicted DNA binding protein